MKEISKNHVSDEIVKQCIRNYFNVTSNESVKNAVCGICGEFCRIYEKNEISCIPNREPLLQEKSDTTNLPEYMIDDLLLHEDGLGEDQLVNCCEQCISTLKRNKLPAFSIANNLQIGDTPLELHELTLPEKILISVYRPKMYVTTFRSLLDLVHHRGLKGNTITFPQDIVKIAKILSAESNILADCLKVIFIGSGKPSKEALKKIFTVRREKVHNALYILTFNCLRTLIYLMMIFQMKSGV